MTTDSADAASPRREAPPASSHPHLSGKPTRWLAFRTERRKGGGRRAGVHGVGFRVVFPHSVRGPIAVGYAAHFGLGYFVPGPRD